MNAASMTQNIARNVQRHVKHVQKNAERWQPNYILPKAGLVHAFSFLKNTEI
jgi:Uri superfamily endonuclease